MFLIELFIGRRKPELSSLAYDFLVDHPVVLDQGISNWVTVVDHPPEGIVEVTADHVASRHLRHASDPIPLDHQLIKLID